MFLKKKSQVTIFLIIAVIIIILFLFLINTNKFNKENTLETAKTNSNLEGNDKLLLIKQNIDSCFKRQLRRATIIAGLRGGYIYNSNEYYAPGILLKNSYPNELLGNLKLNTNFLNGNVLMFSQVEPYTPRINSNYIIDNGTINTTIYPKSIKEEFETFILNEFLTCINLESYKDLGYNISYIKFSGKIKEIKEEENKILFNDLAGEEGDKIQVIFEEKTLIGNLTKTLDSNNLTEVVFKDKILRGLSSNEDFLKLKGLNLNTSISVKVNFEDEKITSKINFPIKISKGDNSIKYTSASEELNVRFKQLLMVIDKLLYAKYINKSLSLENQSHLNSIIDSDYLLKKFNFKRLKIYKTRLNDSKEEKEFVYSIIDNDSKILGSPFIFNFGYENSAPKIDLKKLGLDVLDDYSVLIIVSKNHPITFDLKNITSDKQVIDNYLSHYIAYNYDGPDCKFSINSDGIINFNGYQQKRYSFDISVTDNEATRTRTFVIVTGFPDNTNNSAATDCFSFKNYEIPGIFPIQNEYRNKLFNFINSQNKNIVYGYSLYLNPNNGYILDGIPTIRKSELFFSKTCAFNSKIFKSYYTITNLNTNTIIKSNIEITNDEGKINLSNYNFPVKVEVEVKDSQGNAMTDPFETIIYPANCLGPESISSTNPTYLKLGGDNSCCNMGVLENSIINNKPKSFIGSNSNLYSSSDNHYALNTKMYFCYMPNKDNKKYFNFEENSIWDELGPRATNLFSGSINAKCQGKYPTSTLNINEIKNLGGRTVNLPQTSHLSENGVYVPREIPVSLTIKNSTSTCEFCYINKTLTQILLDNKWELFGGLISENTGSITYQGIVYPLAGISPYEKIPTEPDYYFLAENKWYGLVSNATPGTSPSWSLLSNGFGKNNPKEKLFLHVSKPYCNVGTTNYGPSLTGYGHFKKKEDLSQCKDWYVKSFTNSMVTFDYQTGTSPPYTCP